MLGDFSRRRFIHETAVAAIATTGLAPAWLRRVGRTGGEVPHWRPGSDLLTNIPRLLELAMVPGLAIGVVDDGGVWMRGFGRRRTGSDASVGDDTVFEAASLGKPVCAFAALALVDEGLLALDRPLWDYLPLPDGGDERTRRITLRHVLSHTTGLPNWRKTPGPLLPAAEPGSGFSYSGEAFVYLQRVMETVTQTPFARLMQDRVLGPFGMDHSSFVWRSALADQMATGHDSDGRPMEVMAAIGRRIDIIAREWGRQPIEWRYEDAARAVTLVNPDWPVLPLYMMPNAATSLLCTVQDYLRFLKRVVSPDPAQGLGLAAATSRAMLTAQVALNRELSWGLGWGLERDGDGTLLWQWGANNAFRNFVLADATNGRAVVVLTNGENGPRVYERVINGVTGRDHAAFLWV